MARPGVRSFTSRTSAARSPRLLRPSARSFTINAFNIGQTKENYRVAEIAEIVARTVPNCKIEYAPGAGPDPRCYRVNCDKLPLMVPAYQPQWSAAAAAKQVYEAIKKFGLTLEDFEGTRYARLPHMKKLIAEGVVDETVQLHKQKH